jgi:isopentenyl phosphate kinase (EC 2.7.4.-)
MTTVLKLGGSIITHKDAVETVDEVHLTALSTAIADSSDPLVIVHGGGSFGHHHAAAHGVSSTVGTTEPAVIMAIHSAMRRLNQAVVDRLIAAGVPAVPMAPLGFAHRGPADDLQLASGPMALALERGFTPVCFGDIIMDADRGASILSGDHLVGAVAQQMDADRIGLCGDVAGVLDAEGEVIERITSFAAVADSMHGSAVTDVTGGMAGKVQGMLALGRPVRIFGADDLSGFLAGEAVGTLVDGPQ